MHIKGQILEAVHAAVETVETIVNVTMSSAFGPRSSKGAVCDVKIVEEKASDNTQSFGAGRGVVERILVVACVIDVPVPLVMSAVELENDVLAAIEVAVVKDQALNSLCDDCRYSGTDYNYEQDSKVTTVGAAVFFTITYKTAAGNPGERF